jgi:hypothetical protein
MKQIPSADAFDEAVLTFLILGRLNSQGGVGSASLHSLRRSFFAMADNPGSVKSLLYFG